MKTIIVGWMYMIIPTFISITALLFNVVHENFLWMFVNLLIAVYSVLLGWEIRNHRKWSWYAGLITSLILIIGLFALLSLAFPLLMLMGIFIIIPIWIIFGLFLIYAFLNDRHLFFRDTTTEPIIYFPEENNSQKPLI